MFRLAVSGRGALAGPSQAVRGPGILRTALAERAADRLRRCGAVLVSVRASPRVVAPHAANHVEGTRRRGIHATARVWGRPAAASQGERDHEQATVHASILDPLSPARTAPRPDGRRGDGSRCALRAHGELAACAAARARAGARSAREGALRLPRRRSLPSRLRAIRTLATKRRRARSCASRRAAPCPIRRRRAGCGWSGRRPPAGAA